MQNGQQLLACEQAVSDDAHEKGRRERRDRGCAVRQANFSIREVQGLAEVGAHCDEPHPPDEILQKHHQGETRGRHGSSRIRIFRNDKVPA